MKDDEIAEVDGQASALMERGIALVDLNEAGAIGEAVQYFDRALALRLGLPYDRVPALRFELAVSWLNRADALTRLKDPARLPGAIHDYDEAISLLRTLPLEVDARFPRCLALACQNRGLALAATGPDRLNEAIDGFQEAIAILISGVAAEIEDRRYLLAVGLVNLAGAQLAAASPDAKVLSRDSAQRAIVICTELEAEHPFAAEASLRARHLICQSIVDTLSEPPPADGSLPPLVHTATDVVDEGLALVRAWERRGVSQFRELAFDLFRFGAAVYARYQPQFLEEFLADNRELFEVEIESTPTGT